MYYLKLFDETLLTFDMKQDLTLEISDINVISKDKEKFPIMLKDEINEMNLRNFLNSRIIPKNRGFVYEILNSIGLNINDTKGIIDICKGLSLNDSYFIVQDESLKFKDYNLYDNEFSQTLSLVAFTGYSSKIKGIISSPELTTNGMLPKAWRRINDEVLLYKGSTCHLNFSNTGYEPYSEFYASQIAEKMKINHVNYELDKWKGDLVSICKLFTSKEISYVPIYFAIKNIDIRNTAEFMKENGYFEEFSNMILFDSIIFNVDRHFGNFGLLRDNNTGNYIGMAPIFDNGESLLSKADKNIFNDKKEFEKYINSESLNISNYGVSYDKLVESFCDKRHIEKLRGLLTFKFVKNGQYDLPDNRLELLELMIQKRAIHFIDIIEKMK